MMTRTQARRFKARLEKGEFPPISKECAAVLRMTPYAIVENARHARNFHYGLRLLNCARRLVQMGLFDARRHLTNFGYSYVK